MSVPNYSFDTNQTGGTRFLDHNQETVVWLRENIFPPVGTIISLPNGSDARVKSVTLDLSNDSKLAQVFVELGTSETTES